MAAEVDIGDEELYERDDETEIEIEQDEAESEDTEDSESFIATPGAFPRPFPVPGPLGATRYRGGLSPGREDLRRMRGVRAAVIRGAGGATAVVRLPTAVATMRGVRRLSQRNARAEAVLAQHEGRLRSLRAQEGAIRTHITGAVILQHLRDAVGEARASAALIPAGGQLQWNPILAGTDYTLSAAQTAFSVAAIPASRRTALFWTLPFTSGLFASLGREVFRPPFGFNVNPVAGQPGPIGRGKPGWPDSVLAVGIPALVGAAASYLVRPGRPRRYIRL